MIAGVRWLTAVLVVAACLSIAFGSYHAATSAWDAVAGYESPYLDVAIPASAASEPLVDRTVLVIVDGLTLNESRAMPSLNALRRYGCDLELTADQPSLSYPGWTTILSGVPPHISGVVTNWHSGPVEVETLFDTAETAGVSVVYSGPDDLESLYGAASSATDAFTLPWGDEYAAGAYVDRALEMTRRIQPRLVVVHLPDADEAGHAHGAASAEYRETLRAIDSDLGRLIDGLQDGSTAFVIVSDHGHTASGGHGGWEPEVVTVPGVFAGPAVRLGAATGRLSDVAATTAALAGIPIPRHSIAGPLESVVGAAGLASLQAGSQSRVALRDNVWAVMGGSAGDVGVDPGNSADDTWHVAAGARGEARAAAERAQRLPAALAIVVACVLACSLVALASRQAAAAAAVGAVVYHGLYNALFFLVHGHHWSLSAFNSEDRIQAFMNARLAEAALATVAAALVAAALYPALRCRPKGAWGPYLPGWLTLGPATSLVILATIGVQAAWFIWWWGTEPTWRLPDLIWGFKYNLDLVQATAVGGAAIPAAVVSWLVGRYHPLVDTSRAEE